MEMSSYIHAPAALPWGEKFGAPQSIGDKVGPGADLDAIEKNLSPCRGSNPNFLAAQPVACRYTDWDIDLYKFEFLVMLTIMMELPWWPQMATGKYKVYGEPWRTGVTLGVRWWGGVFARMSGAELQMLPLVSLWKEIQIFWRFDGCTCPIINVLEIAIRYIWTGGTCLPAWKASRSGNQQFSGSRPSHSEPRL
jgi:hypothetical protein